jgi:hypothetical protein
MKDSGMKTIHLLAALAIAAVLAACGGGGGSAPESTPTLAPILTPALGAGTSGPFKPDMVLASFKLNQPSNTDQNAFYSWNKYNDPKGPIIPTPTFNVSGGVAALTGTMTGPGTYGGVLAYFNLGYFDEASGSLKGLNLTKATKLVLQLASTGASKKFDIYLTKVGANLSEGCSPRYTLSVTDQLLNYEIDLTEANFQLPSSCTRTATNPSLTGVLPDVQMIQIHDIGYPKTPETVNVGISIAGIGIRGTVTSAITPTPGATTPPSPPVTTPVGGPLTIASYNGTSRTNQGNILGSYSYASQTLGSVSSPLIQIFGADVFGVDGTFTAPLSWGGAAAVINVTPADYSAKTKLVIQLASEGTNKLLTVMIKKLGAANDGCLPIADVMATSTLTTYTLDLTDVVFHLPADCTATITNPILSGALTNMSEIHIKDAVVPTSGTSTIAIRVGTIAVQ